VKTIDEDNKAPELRYCYNMIFINSWGFINQTIIIKTYMNRSTVWMYSTFLIYNYQQHIQKVTILHLKIPLFCIVNILYVWQKITLSIGSTLHSMLKQLMRLWRFEKSKYFSTIPESCMANRVGIHKTSYANS